MSHYLLNYDIEQFSFFSIEKIGNMNLHRSKFVLDWNEITSEYLAVGIGNIPHFASQYVFAKALLSGRSTHREEMQTMYLDIISGVHRLIESGDLPISI